MVVPLQATGTGLVYKVPPYTPSSNVAFTSTPSRGEVFLTVMLINKAQCPGLSELKTLTAKLVGNTRLTTAYNFFYSL